MDTTERPPVFSGVTGEVFTKYKFSTRVDASLPDILVLRVLISAVYMPETGQHTLVIHGREVENLETGRLVTTTHYRPKMIVSSLFQTLA